MNRAVFLDRDGTILKDIGYLTSPDQIEFIPRSIEAIKMLNQAGYQVVVITNQAGVARGLVAEDMLQTIDKIIQRKILNGGAHLDGIYYCPHHPEHGVYPYRQTCECRKPHTGLIKRASRDQNLDLSQSFMIGDKKTDIEAGKRAGVKTILVLTDQEVKEPANADHVSENLFEAVKWVLSI